MRHGNGMKPLAFAAAAFLLAGSAAWAQDSAPSWVRENAGYWADGILDDAAFLDGIKYLIDNGVMAVPETDVTAAQGDGTVPAWIKNNAALWASGQIRDSDFMGGIGYLVGAGVIVLDPAPDGAGAAPDGAGQAGGDPEIARLQAELDACDEIKKAIKRLDCQDDARQNLTVYTYKSQYEPLRVGPINYYWGGIGSDGNDLEISPTGQAILTVRMLAENVSSDNVALACTSPQICAYDVWDGQSAFKYSGMDFTNGQILVKPGEAKEFNILFGPNIGYGGTQFLYDPARDYQFRISEGFGSASVPLGLGR